jgi:hypothetical protein
MDTNIFEGVEGSLNLKTLYNQCNKKYFGGIMPKCKVKWSGRLKTAIGRAGVKYRGESMRRNSLANRLQKLQKEIPQADVKINMDSLEITIASGNDLTKDDTTAIMLHEMVHILLFSQRKIGGHHGTAEFDGWIKKLRKESGLNIPMKESSFKMSPKLKAKPAYVMLMHQSDGKIGACMYSKKLVYSDEFEERMNKFVRYYFRNGMELYYVAHPIVNTLPSKRTLGSLTWHEIEKDVAKEIQKKGKKIYHSRMK